MTGSGCLTGRFALTGAARPQYTAQAMTGAGHHRLFATLTIRGTLLIVVAASCISATVVTSSSLAAPGTSCGSWKVVPSPNVGSRSNLLYAVSALSDTDVWAVGQIQDGFLR